jgi:hypothetical protein
MSFRASKWLRSSGPKKLPKIVNCATIKEKKTACSMQSGFNSVGVSCSAMSDVSSNGGKYGEGGPH